MIRAIKILIALYSANCFADGIPGLPSTNPNDVPIFYSILSENPKYHDAAFKAQQAFMIQTGVSTTYDKLNGMAMSKVTNTVTSTIDNYTPLNSKDVFFVVGTTYAVGVKKHVTKSFRNPIFPSVENSVDIGEHQQSMGVKISF